MADSYVQRTLLDAADRTATTHSREFGVGHDVHSILLELEVFTDAAPETLLMHLERKSAAGNWHDYIAGTAQAVTAGNVFRMIVALGTTLGGAFADTRRSLLAPGTYRVHVHHSAAGTWNYDLNAYFIRTGIKG